MIQAFKIKLIEELQDYEVKSVFETERLQDYICLKGRVTRLQERKNYKSLSKGERAILDFRTEPYFWTWNLDLNSRPAFCLQSLSCYR